MKPKFHHPIAPGPTAAGGRLQGWNSPVPYLFGGLGLMLGVIALAMMILACSYRKSSSSTLNEKSRNPSLDLEPEMEPRVVIMAGDANPTHIAKPVAAAARRGEQV